MKGRLFVAGGSTGSSNYKGHRDGEELQDSIYCLNMESHTLRWEKINFAINDSLSFAGLCRCHSAVNINDNILFSFGGAPNETTNQLHLLDLSDMEMHRVATVNESHLPRPRQNQSVAMLPCGTRMVVATPRKGLLWRKVVVVPQGFTFVPQGWCLWHKKGSCFKK